MAAAVDIVVAVVVVALVGMWVTSSYLGIDAVVVFDFVWFGGFERFAKYFYQRWIAKEHHLDPPRHHRPHPHHLNGCFEGRD